MTLTSEVPVAQDAWVDGPRAWVKGRIGDGDAVLHVSGMREDEASLSGVRLGVLLEDEAIAAWATEAAERYHVSAIEALGALAAALARDGMSPVAALAEQADSLVPI